MRTIGEIQQAILDLPDSDFQTLSKWFDELDWDRWDAKIEHDARDGQLDFLVSEAMHARANGTLQDL